MTDVTTAFSAVRAPSPPAPAAALPRERPALAPPATTAAVTVALCAVAFGAKGGLGLGATTRIEVGLLAGSGVAGVCALLLAPRRGRLHGGVAIGLFALFAALTALSITWAVDPSDAWVETNRTVSYAATFAAAVALARLVPRRWGGVLGGVALAGTIVCGYALATKIAPGALSPNEPYARLRVPFGYWNATGLMAALAVPSCLWLGARRHGHAAVNALAYPMLGVLATTLMLAYSRGSLLALVVGLAFWLAVVPLRLRAAAVLATSLVITAPLVVWAYTRPALTDNQISLTVRESTGVQFGIAVAATLALLLVAGLVIGFHESVRGTLAARVRRRRGVAILAALALLPVAGAIALATTDRGLTGSVSHAFNTVTDPNAKLPKNGPGRLTAVGSVRARYWNEALKAFQDEPVHGVGAGGYATARLRYRTELVQVQHAHGFVVQTLADLGVIGLALALALALAWIVAACRATGLTRRDRGRPFDPERIGLLTLGATVVVFAAHSLIDWTWFVPGVAVIGLLCAGWVAGRGPLREREPGAVEPPLRWRPRAWQADQTALLGAAGLVLVTLTAAWAVVQPLRSQSAIDASYARIQAGDLGGGMVLARSANFRNPLDIEPLNALAIAQARANQVDEARRTLEREVRLQPRNPVVWRRLADFQLSRLADAPGALRSIKAALYLNPRDPGLIGPYLGITRQVTAEKTGKTP